MNSIENIINRLGYSDSKSLYRRKDFEEGSKRGVDISRQTLHLLRELDPYACYFVNGKPFVLFFNEINDTNMKKLKHQKVWNSQTAVAIFDCITHIEIYNGYALNESSQELHSITKLNSNEIDELSPFSYWNITNENFWNHFKRDFSHNTLDETLLDNVSYIIDYIQKRTSRPFAVKFTLRLIFIRFLIDREVDLYFPKISIDSSLSVNEQFLQIVKSKRDLYQLFDHLKQKFNGNLFEYLNDDKQSEMELLDKKMLAEIHLFLSGKIQLPNNQLTLFPLYDFKVIPVELISNIYERLLGVGQQKQDSAFYTPPHLVDYIFTQTIDPFLINENKFTLLDPSCGSGIFLVEALRRLIEKNLGESEYFLNDQELVALLTDHIYGIDKNPEAIDVATFSLYLTLLDYKDPKSLQNFKLPILKEKNFFTSDFFSDVIDKHLQGATFDFIVGNPPWGKVDSKLHMDYCKKRDIPIQNKEISRSFIARTKDFSTKDTQCCLIVHSKLFYNSEKPAKAFREWLLSHAKVSRFIELSPVRNLIFKNAKGPAAIVFYSYNDLQVKDNHIEHLTLMPHLLFELFHTIVIEPTDRKIIPQQLLLKNDWAWKTVVFGTSHDFRIIKSLQNNFKTMLDIAEENNFSFGSGIETAKGTDDTNHLIGKKLLNARTGITPFKVDPAHSETFSKKKIHRAKVKMQRIFKPPYTLFKKGANINNFKLRAGYSEVELIYTDTVYGIAGTEETKNVLLSFTGLLNSSFYAYLNLMLSSSIGIEREQAFPTQVMSFPAIMDDVLAKKVARIQGIIAQQGLLEENDQNDIEALINKLDYYILSIFDLQDDPFIDYALNVQIPLLTGNSQAHREVTINELEKYIEPFLTYWDDVLKKNLFTQFIIYPNILNRFTAIEVAFVEHEPNQKTKIIEDKNEHFELISRFTLRKQNDLFYELKDVINFEDDSFYILKSNEYKNWHPAISEIDLAKVIDAVFQGGGDSNERV